MQFPRHALRTARSMLKQKRSLALAALGLGISTLSFGAGTAMLLPIMNLMLQDKEPLPDLIRRKVSGPLADAGTFIADRLPADPFRCYLLVMGIVAGLTVVGALGRTLHFRQTNALVLRTVQGWQKRVFLHIARLPMESVWRQGSAALTTRLNNDAHQLTTGLQALTGKILEAIFRAGAAVAVAFWANPKLTGLAVLIALPGLALTARFGKRMRKLMTQQADRQSLIMDSNQRVLHNTLAMKAATAERSERRRYHRASQFILRIAHKAATLRQLSRTLQEVMGTLAAIGIACWAGHQILRMGLPAKEFIAVVGALGMAAGSLKPLSEIGYDLQISDVAAERILRFIGLGGTERLWWAERRDQPKLPALSREIRFEGVSYTYPGKEEPAIRDLTVALGAGEFVAIVGANGSGKSTLMLLLGRYVDPSSGRITFDGADIAGRDLVSLRAQMGMVAQRTALVGGTVAENIAYGQPWARQEDIERAARIATADEFIRQLPNEYKFKVGSGGEGLSGGQAQRVCIARALLRDPRILIMDEATSMVDPESESRIAEAMGEITKGRTTIAIAHRLSTVRRAHRILVMEAGRIVADGTHEDLLANSPAYQAIARDQLAS